MRRRERAADAAARAGAATILAMPLVSAAIVEGGETSAAREPLRAGPLTPAAAHGHGSFASAFGPGMYGNRLACGGRLWPGTVGVAHRWLRCGTRLRICRRRRCVHLRVIDRGPFIEGRELDLTEGAVRQLGVATARAWGVRWVTWRRT